MGRGRLCSGCFPLTCPGIFGPRVFRDNGSLNLRSSDEASEVYGRTNRPDIAGGGSVACGGGGQAPRGE